MDFFFRLLSFLDKRFKRFKKSNRRASRKNTQHRKNYKSKSPRRSSRSRSKTPSTRPAAREKSEVRPGSKRPKAGYSKNPNKNIRPVSATLPVKSSDVLIGEITHYFSKIEVCVLKMTAGTLMKGDEIRIKGPTVDFRQRVESLQVESVDVNVIKKGQLAGLKVRQKVRVGEKVYRISK